MIILDTDHITVIQLDQGERCERLARKIEQVSSIEPVGVSIVSVEEQMRGWLAVIARERTAPRQVRPYEELQNLFSFFGRLMVVPLSAAAADEFEHLRSARIRIGTMDLKIAAIAIAQQATLVTSNLRDFEKVPGLKIENWLA